jgi:adenylate kinase
MLREAVAECTASGLRVKHIMDRGELVPDDVVISVIASRIDHSDAANGFILDGFPRTVAQAEALDQELAARGIKLDAVLDLEVDEDALLDRIRGRAEEAASRGEPVRRDDNPEVFKTRLEVYREQTAPVTEYYRSRGLLNIVDGLQPIDAVTEHLLLRWQRCRPLRSGVVSDETFHVPGAAEHSVRGRRIEETGGAGSGIRGRAGPSGHR